MVLSPAPFHCSPTDSTPLSGDSGLRSRLRGSSVQAGQNAEYVVLPAIGSPLSLVVNGNMVPTMRAPHMEIDHKMVSM